MRWIHDDLGGRRYDVGAVKYESDLTSIPHLLLRRLKPRPEVPLKFTELTFHECHGIERGEHLDIDWDGLASINYAPSHTRRLLNEFLSWDFKDVPSSIYLAYSPGYSQPDRRLFEEFLQGLSLKFGADVQRLSASKIPKPDLRPPRLRMRIATKAVLRLHRLGIY